MHIISKIQIQDATLHRGGYCILEHVNSLCKAGTCTVLLGANGVGKTSLLRAICGLLPLSSGKIIIDSPKDTSQLSHFIANEGMLKPILTVQEHIELWCSIFMEKPNFSAVNIAQQIGLAAFVNTPAGMLSSGQKRRLSLARLLCAPRPIWCLDEPTNALDEKGMDIFRILISQHLSSSGIAIIATHVQPLIEGEIPLLLADFIPQQNSTTVDMY